ncbi:TIGR00366 family protein [Sorangium sp. KYC3313]|uniref:TIGR00366 family protein n=1 Tax=Sorangium sp. KYC3313 TaxID=3449740 RepID=UPI003F8B462C
MTVLGRCAYFGTGATWHSGVSASAPLRIATPGHFLEKTTGIVPIDETLFSAFNQAPGDLPLGRRRDDAARGAPPFDA